MALWTSFVAGTVLVVLLLLLIGRINSSRKLPPGPLPLPVFGNLLHLFGKAPQRSLARLSKRYGPIFYLRLGFIPAVVVSNASLAKEFLSSFDKVFASRPPLEFSRRMTYGLHSGVTFASYGPRWRHARKICGLQLFTVNRVREFEPVRMEEIKLMIKDLEDQAQQGTRFVNIRKALENLTENITGRILFRKRLSEVIDAGLGASLRDLVYQALDVLEGPVIGDFIPYLGWLDGKIKRRMEELHKAFDIHWETLLSGRSKSVRGKDAGGDPKDFVDVLLSNNVSKHELKAILQDLVSAAIHTTSVTLEWAMAELLRSPRILRKLQQELDTVVGRRRMVEESDLIDLIYLKAVVKETLRLYPVAPLLLPHMSTEACTVAGYTLPKGTRLMVNVWAIGRDPELWEEPEKFLPERFVGKNIDVRGQHFELLPFGAGRRSCPGLPLAMVTAEVTLANLTHHFDWELPSGQQTDDMSEGSGFVLCLANPVVAVPRPRHS